MKSSADKTTTHVYTQNLKKTKKHQQFQAMLLTDPIGVSSPNQLGTNCSIREQYKNKLNRS